MAKSLWVQFRDWLTGRARHIIEFMTPSENALADAIPEDLLPQATSIAISAIKAAERAGGGSGAKYDAAVAVILPAFKTLGIQIAKAALQIFVSNLVIKLGYSKNP